MFLYLRCLNYYVCDKPFYLLVDYLSVRFPTTDALEVIRKVLGMKADYFIHYDYGYYGYKEHYAYGEIKVMASDDEHMGVFLELKGAGSRNMEYVLQAQNRDWYSFLNRLKNDALMETFYEIVGANYKSKGDYAVYAETDDQCCAQCQGFQLNANQQHGNCCRTGEALEKQRQPQI